MKWKTRAGLMGTASGGQSLRHRCGVDVPPHFSSCLEVAISYWSVPSVLLDSKRTMRTGCHLFGLEDGETGVHARHVDILLAE